MSVAAPRPAVVTDVVEVRLLSLAGAVVEYGWLEEPERAHALRLGARGATWAAARTALRALLGDRLGVPPGRVSFTYGAAGKPALAPKHASPLHFNLAHAGTLALVALRAGAEVGVDLEALRPGVACEAVARAQFGATELADFLAAPAAAREAAFFRAWVRHEAVAKAGGAGIGSVLPDTARAGWTVRDLRAPAGYAAAVASAGDGWRLRFDPA